MGNILLRDLEVIASVGVHAWEQSVTQRLLFDVDIEYDLRAAAASDKLEHALDYARVASEIRGLAQQRHYQLLESLAEVVSQHLMAVFPLKSMTLSIWKPDALPGVRAVGIRVQHSCKTA